MGLFPRGVTWPNSTIRLSHHRRLVPHSTALSNWFYHPFLLAKIPSNYQKKESNYLSTTTFSGRIVKTPPMQVQLVKNTPKTWKIAEPISGFWSSHPPLGLLWCSCIKCVKHYNDYRDTTYCISLVLRPLDVFASSPLCRVTISISDSRHCHKPSLFGKFTFTTWPVSKVSISKGTNW